MHLKEYTGSTRGPARVLALIIFRKDSCDQGNRKRNPSIRTSLLGCAHGVVGWLFGCGRAGYPSGFPLVVFLSQWCCRLVVFLHSSPFPEFEDTSVVGFLAGRYRWILSALTQPSQLVWCHSEPLQ